MAMEVVDLTAGDSRQSTLSPPPPETETATTAYEAEILRKEALAKQEAIARPEGVARQEAAANQALLNQEPALTTKTASPPPYTLPPDLKARIKRTYDHISPSYNSVTIYHPLQRLNYLDKFLSYVLPSTPGAAALADRRLIRVLELGSGSGVPVMERLLNDGRFHVTGNDISTTQIMLGKALCGGLPGRTAWVECDMMELEYPAHSLDAVMAFYSLIHVPRHEEIVLFGRIRQWLRPGGHVIMNFASQDMEGIDVDNWFADDGWMFWSGWGPERTLEELQKAGLEVVFHEIAVDDQPFLWVIAKTPEVVDEAVLG